MEDDMQVAAMNANFREGIPCKFAPVLAINQLPETVEKAALAILDAGLEQFIAEAKRAELAHRMRQQGDTDAKRLDLRRTLIDAACNAALLEIEGERKPANSAADDRYFHSVTPSAGSPF